MAEKTDIIDKFMNSLSEDLLAWDYAQELNYGSDRLRVWSKNTNNEGEPLAPSEIHFRVQCIIKDIKPEIAFKCMSDSEERNKWDPRMKDIQKVEED